MQNKEKHSQAAILGLQHFLALYSGSIWVQSGLLELWATQLIN